LKNKHQMVAISTGNLLSKSAWAQTPPEKGGIQGVDIPLLSDPTGEICSAYGMLRVEAGYSFRGFVVVDPVGVIACRTLSDLPLGVGVAEALRVYAAAELTCRGRQSTPPGWQPGQPTLASQFYTLKQFSPHLEARKEAAKKQSAGPAAAQNKVKSAAVPRRNPADSTKAASPAGTPTTLPGKQADATRTAVAKPKPSPVKKTPTPPVSGSKEANTPGVITSPAQEQSPQPPAQQTAGSDFIDNLLWNI
jgi:hypothetical protein